MSEQPTPAEVLRRMADRIDLNAPGDFSGAFIIIGPDGIPHEALLIDSKPNPVSFWSLVRGRVEIAWGEVEATQRAGGWR